MPKVKWLVLEKISVDLRPGSQLLQDLCAATALEHLHSEERSVLGHLHHPLPGGALGAAELLVRLAELTKLKVLHLACIDRLLQCPPVAFSSLTQAACWGA